MTKLDQENVWKIVKKIRISLLSEHTALDCYIPMLSDEIIQGNINQVALELNLNTSSTPNENVSKHILQRAVEIFTYLNYCPSLFIPKPLLLYANLLKNGTVRDIVLALTSIIKTSQNTQEREDTIKNLENLMKSFHLKEFENIQILTKGKCYTNSTFGNCSKRVKIKDYGIIGFSKISNTFFNLSFRIPKVATIDKSSSSHH